MYTKQFLFSINYMFIMTINIYYILISFNYFKTALKFCYIVVLTEQYGSICLLNIKQFLLFILLYFPAYFKFVYYIQ